MRVRMHGTGRVLVRYDKGTGEIIRRKVYNGQDGRQYVRLGKFCATNPDTYVDRVWFCEHIVRDGMVEREQMG